MTGPVLPEDTRKSTILTGIYISTCVHVCFSNAASFIPEWQSRCSTIIIHDLKGQFILEFRAGPAHLEFKSPNCSTPTLAIATCKT